MSATAANRGAVMCWQAASCGPGTASHLWFRFTANNQCLPQTKRGNPLCVLKAAVACFVVAVGLAPVAHADSQDDKYLAALAGQGITGEPAQLIADGHAACDNYGGPGLVGQMFGLEGRGLSNVQASNLMVTGIRAYCPEKTPLGGL